MSTRGRWQGTINIVRFHWPIYVVAMVVAVVGIVVAMMAAAWVAAVATAMATAAIVLTGLSLLGSYWSYDRSRLYEWQWLAQWLPTPMTTWAHVHTGLDESSATLKQLHPQAALHIFDASDNDAQTEPSIARARAIVPLHPDTITVGLGPLPLAPASIDALLLPMAAHEVRDDDTRAQWLRTMATTVRAGGHIIVIEHLRDVPNMLAFHLGVMHFLSRNTWLRTFAAAGLVVVKEQRIASFLWVFSLRKDGHG